MERWSSYTESLVIIQDSDYGLVPVNIDVLTSFICKGHHTPFQEWSGGAKVLGKLSDAEASFLDLHLSISDGFVETKIYDKRDDFDFDIVNFPFLDGDVPRSASYGVYISQLIRFARVSSHVDDFNTSIRF